MIAKLCQKFNTLICCFQIRKIAWKSNRNGDFQLLDKIQQYLHQFHPVLYTLFLFPLSEIKIQISAQLSYYRNSYLICGKMSISNISRFCEFRTPCERSCVIIIIFAYRISVKFLITYSIKLIDSFSIS